MGQKINPTGFRLPVTRNWTSRWYANGRDYPNTLQEDLKVRSFLLKKLRNASVARVLIERPANNARITIFTSRPGIVIGKQGADIEDRSSEDDGCACARQHRRSSSSRTRRSAHR